MTVEELARLGRQVREAQRAFFATRSAEAMRRAKSLEKQFDEAVALVLDGPKPVQGDIFAQKKGD